MNHNLIHHCRRLSGRKQTPPEDAHHTSANVKHIGGGSGGGPEDGAHSNSYDGRYSIAANEVEFVSRPPIPPAVPGPYIISLLAAGMGTDGRVEVRGTQGVRVTTGPPLLPPGSSESTNGVEVVVGETQNITIQRGLVPGVDQQIEMEPGSIVVDGGVGTVTVQSLTEVKLSVAGGLSSITLTPAAIIIQGPLVMIN
jgi:hypothetical protein